MLVFHQTYLAFPTRLKAWAIKDRLEVPLTVKISGI